MDVNAKQINNDKFTLKDAINKRSYASIQILNELEFLISSASNVPLTSRVMVDAEELFDLTEKFKQSFPDELNQAESVIREIQDVVLEAETKAEKIVAQAEALAHSILSESKIIRDAQHEASLILRDANASRDAIQKETEDYVESLFVDVEQRLLDNAQSVRQSIETIKSSR